VDEIRATIPEVCLSTDIICGFPTETEAEFEATLDVVGRVEFDSAFVFKYSERKNTIAQRKYPDDVPEAAKTDRVVRLNALQKAISLRRNQAWIGRRVRVLLEGPSRKSPDDLLGRDDANHGVVLSRNRLVPGDLAWVEITGASAHTLLGREVASPSAPSCQAPALAAQASGPSVVG
jgi:tRNA-2-methylthio-N6-dimethylallyladenosine synthase